MIPTPSRVATVMNKPEKSWIWVRDLNCHEKVMTFNNFWEKSWLFNGSMLFQMTKLTRSIKNATFSYFHWTPTRALPWICWGTYSTPKPRPPAAWAMRYGHCISCLRHDNVSLRKSWILPTLDMKSHEFCHSKYCGNLDLETDGITDPLCKLGWQLWIFKFVTFYHSLSWQKDGRNVLLVQVGLLRKGKWKI